MQIQEMHFKDTVCFARELQGDTTRFFVAWGHLILECHYIAIFTFSNAESVTIFDIFYS